MRVLLTEPAARAFGDSLLAAHRGIELVAMGDGGTLRVVGGGPIGREGTGIEVAWATSDLYDDDRATLRPFFGLVRRLDTLRWFQSAAAGYEAPIFAELIARGVLFTKSDVHSVPIAEYVLRAVLDHAQRPERWAAAQAGRRWERHEFEEVCGTTWVVVGFGSIGAEVARLATALGAHVVGVRRHPDPDDHRAEMVTPDRLAEVLGRADVVVLAAPANASTRHLVDRRFLEAMKPSALLVNIGRGSVVDEEALLAALDAGRPAAAVLDVFETEPLPAESPLWAHPRVTVTPHNSAIAGARMTRAAALFGENLSRFLAGEALLNAVTQADLD